jgi:hypothetical protein
MVAPRRRKDNGNCGVKELRAVALGGDLRDALAGPLPEARKTLKKFPGIADPRADRILLSGGIAP